MINWLRGRIFILPNEKLSIYNDGFSWRVCDEVGNFLNVGTIVSSDAKTYINAVPLNGTDGDVLQHARIFNER